MSCSSVYSEYSAECSDFVFGSYIQQRCQFTSSTLLHATPVIYKEANIQKDQGKSEHAPVIPMTSCPIFFPLPLLLKGVSTVFMVSRTSRDLLYINMHIAGLHISSQWLCRHSSLLHENWLTSPNGAVPCHPSGMGLYHLPVISFFQPNVIIHHRY